MRALLTAAVLGLAVIAAGCVEPSTGTPSSDDLADFGVQPSVTVEIDDDGVAPDTLDIAANSTISITNTGTEPHGLVQPDTLPDRRIETGQLVPGETVDVHLADPGPITLTTGDSGDTLTLDIGPPEPVR